MPSSIPKYAEGTKVSPEKSQVEAQQLLKKYGATSVATGEQGDNQAVIGFQYNHRIYRIILAYPELKAFRMAGNRGRSMDQQRAARDQEVRRLWRVLILVLKGKLEAATSGVVTFEQEFLSHMVVNETGQTMYEWIKPRLDSSNTLYLPPPKEAE